MTHVNIPALVQRAHPLVQISDGQAITLSTEVARVFGKQHAHVLRDIRTLVDQIPSSNASNFGLVDYTDEKGERRPAYHLTRDGFTLLAMGFTGKCALAFKLAYIDAFNKMEAALLEPAQPAPAIAAPTQQEIPMSAPESHKDLSPEVAQAIATQASQSILDALQKKNLLIDWPQVIDALADRNTPITFHELTDLTHACLTRLQRSINAEAYRAIERRAAHQGVSTEQVSLNA